MLCARAGSLRRLPNSIRSVGRWWSTIGGRSREPLPTACQRFAILFVECHCDRRPELANLKCRCSRSSECSADSFWPPLWPVESNGIESNSNSNGSRSNGASVKFSNRIYKFRFESWRTRCRRRWVKWKCKEKHGKKDFAALSRWN